MFTGLVETVGTVEAATPRDTTEEGGNGFSLTIGDAAEILGDCHLGDSIAVNGVCLTVTQFDAGSFKVGVAPETLKLTNLGQLKKGDHVNLERAVSTNTRFGGHFVQGHVDTTAEIVSVVPDENSLRFTFRPRDQSQMLYIVKKGFIAIDGTSLTVTDVDDVKGTFGVMLISYTRSKVVLPAKKVGDTVNIETDLLGKLAAKQVKAAVAASLSVK